jgi:hypothetical protein
LPNVLIDLSGVFISTLTTLPPIVAGPLLRHCDTKQINIWLVTTDKYQMFFRLLHSLTQKVLIEQALDSEQLQQIQIGRQAFVNLISIKTDESFPENTLLEYDLRISNQDGQHSLLALMPDIVYEYQTLPSFVIKSQLSKILHGSCRKPHFDSSDGLRQVDNLLKTSDFSAENRPSMLMMSGDQIYTDDVAGPMLVAIHQVIDSLGLFDESWVNDADPKMSSSQALFSSDFCYYQRQEILPHDGINIGYINKFFATSKKLIFTSAHGKNHLVTLAEVMAMYLLVWSPELWDLVDLDEPERLGISTAYRQKFLAELGIINEFSAGLKEVRRAMAHLPVYMIFDDHDVTDDWNLTRGWEEAAYGNPFSKKIIGNALIGYWLCQGWGNAPVKFSSLTDTADDYFGEQGVNNQAELIDILLAWQQWHYHLDTSPKVVVLDTRTQRWRSESKAGKPSGLMDWEALSELQQVLINEPCVIMVSPAPVYGVKLIETVQRVFTFFGQPLAVDAENWMAHPGTANVMLNIFRHPKTPPNFIILSGDVHYSFVYEVTHRFKRSSSKILQVTCSGIKNQFPLSLLNVLEKFNRYLYASYSPLNWFTKRRRMKIKVRKPNIGIDTSLYNGSGIGQIKLSDNNETIETEIITSKNTVIKFISSDSD